MQDDVLAVIITCPSREGARAIGQALVAERLAACVNLRAHEAIYFWDGALQAEDEVALFAKTTRARFAALTARVVAFHPHDVPCVVAWPITDGHAPFLDWVRSTTARAPEA